MADNPIVYVTEPWQTMCGFTYEEASGQNPRIVQGERTDQKGGRAISGALANQSACKVQFVNYRRGSLDQPFWNMLSISPVLYQGNVMFYMANLQDYSYHISQMVSLTPSQFCRAATHHQRGRRLQMLDPLVRSKPAIYEIDLEFPVPCSQGKTNVVAATPQPIKRLGWNNLVLEPEHLSERLKDALQTMGASYELHICGDQEGEIFVLHAKIDAVACRLTVSEDPADGTQRISVTRLAGDTFEYHKAFRQLREHLGSSSRGAWPRWRLAWPPAPRPALGRDQGQSTRSCCPRHRARQAPADARQCADVNLLHTHLARRIGREQSLCILFTSASRRRVTSAPPVLPLKVLKTHYLNE